MLMLPMWWNLASFSVAGDTCELAAACLMKFLLLGLKLSISRQVLRLQELLLFFLPLGFEIINFSEDFRLILDI